MKKIYPFLVFLLLVPLVAASYISITTTISSGTIYHNSTTLQVSLKQGGDEAAYEVSVNPILPNSFSYQGSLSKQRFDPQKKLKGNFTLFLNQLTKPGNYPLVIQTIYHDANMYPFSTVSPHLITYQEKTNPQVYGTISDLEITKEGSGDLKINVRNLDDNSHQVSLNLHLPKELKSESYSKIINLDSKEEKELSFKVSSLGALMDSSYSILASLEYESPDYHYTNFARGIVKIVESKQSPKLLLILIALFVVLLLIFVYFRWFR